ncbi:hypothetical protein C1I94_05065 [Akkermansia muciniphila]|uniref:Uncharacterized protein n=1 Tax=Akkermansia muciniphila TaxID=239935 RepID=A0AAP8NKU7_9BACT|nr:hypothetical protein [Akkermansia muciniphila]OLA90989.1 MAG: hypothetical protein BHW66_01705 [Akkermansia sp. 54_46]PNC55008.1 hypothetical protein CXU06_00530 [Akkermansia muciniphila]PNC56206.1 hypothetical protein CXU09_06145 [Akkermansia muciniphila]PNC65494.1 hypothetical protein CXU00_08080 [Akkermansia muciniphila]
MVFGIAALAHAIILEHGQGLFLRFYPVRGCRSFRKYFPWRSGFTLLPGYRMRQLHEKAGQDFLVRADSPIIR